MREMRKDRSWFKATALCGLLVLAVVVVWGCSSAKGQNLAERADILTAMKGMGFRFDDTLLSTEYGDSHSQIVVTGPFGGPPKVLEGSVTNKDLVCPYSRAVLNKVGEKWSLAAIEKRSLGWWPLPIARETCSKQ
jgi:hypothetical protein